MRRPSGRRMARVLLFGDENKGNAVTVTPDLGYASLMLTAILAAVITARLLPAGLPLPPGQKIALGAGGLCGAMIAARLPFVLYDAKQLWVGTAWFGSGKTILAGLVGGYFAVEVTKWVLDIRVKTGDHLIVPVAVGVGVGRLACFHAGCCYGTPSHLPWAVVFPTIDALPRHPTQLYEAVFHLAAAIVLYRLLHHGLFPWQLAKLYIMAYAVFRFGTETIRPEARLMAGLTAYQWASLVIIPVFGVLWLRDRKRWLSRHAGTATPGGLIKVAGVPPIG